ncbi:MAG: GDP-mannose 4,6-dehydratase [Flavobacteriaceae bacterium]|nr:GDP-mannose 4,6-dehydratase [Flavobacteriaceae bacterium]MCI5087809.1 GDP-mannose 4,6-dehydratase [Flavobacteriaceae bacterium]
MILITGGKGHLATLLKNELLRCNEPNTIILAARRNFKSSSNCVIEIGDLQDINFIRDIFRKHKITKVFNLATESFVDRNLTLKNYLDYNRCKIFDNIVQVISENNKSIWLFHPLSSELFGIPKNVTQGNNTLISPINSYGIQKSMELLKCRFLNSQGFNIFHPILFNIESSLRSEKFFTRRIIQGLINYKTTGEGKIKFYNAYSTRDFSYGPDVVKLFYLAMTHEFKGDECFGSSKPLTVIDFIKLVLSYLEINYNISEKNGHISINDSKGNIIAFEADRSLLDESRKFRFNGCFNNSFWISNKIRGGEELVKLLIEDYQKLLMK